MAVCSQKVARGLLAKTQKLLSLSLYLFISLPTSKWQSILPPCQIHVGSQPHIFLGIYLTTVLNAPVVTIILPFSLVSVQAAFTCVLWVLFGSKSCESSSLSSNALVSCPQFRHSALYIEKKADSTERTDMPTLTQQCDVTHCHISHYPKIAL